MTHEFEPIEGLVEVVSVFPSELFEDVKEAAKTAGIPFTDILKKDISLLTHYCDFVSGYPAADDHSGDRLFGLVGREKPLVDIEFHEHKREAPGATKRVKLIMPDSLGIDLDATAAGLGLESTADLVLYAAFLGRHINKYLTNPPLEE